jgi:Mn2+/Fe2+ NRAMP family transporter
VKRALKIALGVVSSIGGYLDVGAIATMAQAGALFRFRHLWVVALGTVCAIALAEMSGRFAAVSKHTIRAAMREQLGASFFVFTLLVSTIVNVLTIAAEIGGTALALQLVTGIGFQWWGVPVAVLGWFILWRGNFSILENGIAVLGLVTVVFVVGAVMAHPPWGQVALGLVPRAPDHDQARYWFIAVGILGAIISPYMFYFYSSGAVEDRWDETYIGINRAVAVVGMGFGATVGAGVLVAAATTFLPLGITVDRYEQAALVLVPTLGKWGFFLFAASLGITCLGATMEATVSTAYEFAQGLGWNWGESVKPHEAARFSFAYTIVMLVACLPTALGLEPLKLTIFSMALNALILPTLVLPFLVLMNQKEYLGEHTNHRFGNIVVGGIVLITFVLALVSIPLEVFGG